MLFKNLSYNSKIMAAICISDRVHSEEFLFNQCTIKNFHFAKIKMLSESNSSHQSHGKPFFSVNFKKPLNRK